MARLFILHGLGQKLDDWQLVGNHLNSEVTVLDLFGRMSPNSEWTLTNLYDSVKEPLNEIEEPFYLCGLSLGGLLVLMYATQEKNPYLKGIIVSGAIYKSIPKVINIIQTTVFNFLPKSQFEKMGLTRKQAITLMKSVNINLEEELTHLDIPTLIICGEKDKINVKASKEIHQLTRHRQSHLEIIPGGGHELNKDKPVEFSILVNIFME